MLTPDPPRTVLVETTWRTRQDVVRRLLGAARRLGMDPRVVRWAGRGYVVPERPVSKRQRVENALRADPTLLKLTIREIARRLDADASTVSRVRKHLLDQQEVS
jgi:CRP-like cAMP-binding protein